MNQLEKVDIFTIIKNNILYFVLLSVVIFNLMGGLMADYLFCVFAGPVGSATAVPLSLLVAVILFLVKRTLTALYTSLAIILCCALTLVCTTKILCLLRHFSYTETAEIVLSFWYWVFF